MHLQFRIILFLLVGTVALAGMEHASATEFFIVTESGNLFRINEVENEIISVDADIQITPGLSPTDPVRAAEFDEFILQNARIIADGLEGGIITGEDCSSLLDAHLPTYEPGCPIEKIRPYMDTEGWEFAAHLDDGRYYAFATAPFRYHTLDRDMLTTTHQMLPQNQWNDEGGIFSRNNPTFPDRYFDTARWVHAGNNAWRTPCFPPVPCMDISHSEGEYGTETIRVGGAPGYYARQFSVGALINGCDGGHCQVSVFADLPEGVILRFVEYPGNTPNQDGRDIERKPAFVGSYPSSKVFTYESPTTGLNGMTWLVVDTRNRVGDMETVIHLNSGISTILIDHEEHNPYPYSYAVEMDGIYQTVGYFDGSTDLNRIEASHPTTFYGDADDIILHVDVEPMYGNDFSSDLVFDHKNGEVFNLGDDVDPKLINVYSYVRIPVVNFAAVEITNAKLVSSDGSELELPYINGLYDPEGLLGGNEARYIYVPVIPMFQEFSIDVGTYNITHSFSDIWYDNSNFSNPSENTEKYSRGWNIDLNTHPDAHISHLITAETPAVYSIISNEASDYATVWVNFNMIGNGHIKNSKILSESNGGWVRTTAEMDDRSTIRVSPPLEATVDVLVNGEHRITHEILMDIERPDIACWYDLGFRSTAHCDMSYVNLIAPVSERFGIGEIDFDDHIEFLVTAKMTVGAPNEDSHPAWSGNHTPANYRVNFQWSDAEATIKIVGLRVQM